MRYDLLPPPPGVTGGTPKKPTAAPAKAVAGALISKIGRSSRSRRTLFLSILLAATIVGLILGTRHADRLQLAASRLGNYVPDSVTDAFAQYAVASENTRWDDDFPSKDIVNKVDKKPKFHLLIPARKPSANLCRTVLSAAILNYPPTTLVGYGEKRERQGNGAADVNDIFQFLLGKEAHDDDLILIASEDTLFQLPAEVTLNRFFHGTRDTDATLLKTYGTTQVRNSNNVSSIIPESPKYTQRVLFSASKHCSNHPDSPSCHAIPESPLPNDIFGPSTDTHPSQIYHRPRYISPSMILGRVSDLRPIYKHAFELSRLENVAKHEDHHTFATIFGEQEFGRQIYATSQSNKKKRKWYSFLFPSKTTPQAHSKPVFAPPGNASQTPHETKNFEFGIGLDYSNSIFQATSNSQDDIRFLTFDHPTLVKSPSKIAAKAFEKPITLAPDVLAAPNPFARHKSPSAKPNATNSGRADMRDDERKTWRDVSLATNVIVPGSSVPASLSLNGETDEMDKFWKLMWYHKHSRALFRQVVRSADGPIAAVAAAEGGDRWWDLRGGKGGIWTDRGEWLDWNEVCGGFDEEVFGDGRRRFGEEEEIVAEVKRKEKAQKGKKKGEEKKDKDTKKDEKVK